MRRVHRWLHTLQVGARRVVLFFILLVPERVRTALRRNALLTSIYEYFDRSKYEDLQAPGPAAVDADEVRSLPHHEYRYLPPRLTDDIRTEIEGVTGPLISVIMPVYDTDPGWLHEAVESVRGQWYPRWELCIVDDCSGRRDTVEMLQRLAALDDPRIRVQRLPENRNIAGASNAALAMAQGEYVALLDHDDALTPDALYRVWRRLRRDGAEFVFSDEDKLDEQGRYCEPHFKPDYSRVQFLAQNYLCHLSVIRRALLLEVGGFSEGVDGAQDYDLFLKVLERTDRIAHIPRVLYHWRKVPGSTAADFDEKSYAAEAGRRALQRAMERRGTAAEVEIGRFPGTYRVRYAIEDEPLVSIVIPFRDEPDLLDTCLGSIVERSSWRRFEVIGVSNNSERDETFAVMDAWSKRDPRVRFVRHDVPFNFSEINNFAVRECARGEQVVLLNNDIEIISEDWIEALLEYAQQPEVGVVGGKLYYPDRTLQHAGVIVGLGGVAGHSHKHFGRDDPGYKFRPHIPQNLSAVTAACCMVRRAVYDEVGGLDEERYRVAFNDVDFCLRVLARGYRNVFTPYCEAWHYESRTRGYEDTPEKRRRFAGEIERFKADHADFLAAGDPCYNPNLTLAEENFHLSIDAQRRREEAGAETPAGP